MKDIEPKLWGPCLWKSIHLIALGYPKEPTIDNVQAYKQFYQDFYKVIPCDKCSVNYRKHLEELPIDRRLTSRDDLFRWTVELHNIVNKSLGKDHTWTPNKAKAKLFKSTPVVEGYASNNTSMYWITSIIFAIIVLAVLLRYKKYV